MEQMLQLARHERTDPHLVAQWSGSRNSSQKLLEAKVQAHVGFGGGQALSRIHHQRAYRLGQRGEQLCRTVGEEGIVAGKQLVASVARKRHRHPLARETTKKKRGRMLGSANGSSSCATAAGISSRHAVPDSR